MKYHNIPDYRQGQKKLIRFASKREAARYDELMLLLRAGEIRDLRLQPEFTLAEAYTTPTGERIRAIRYKADFSYEEKQMRSERDHGPVEKWVKVVEDAKGVQTQVYKLKKKLMLEHGIAIREV